MTDSNISRFVASVDRRYGRGLRRYLSVHTRDLQDLPDLVQEVYLRLLRVSHQETIRNPEAYLLTIAGHVVRQYLLLQSTNAPLFTDISGMDITEEVWQLVTPDGEDPAARAENIQQMERFQKEILARLPPREAAALVLHRIYGYSVQETADQMGVTRETAKTYLADAVRRCCKAEYGRAQDD